MKKKNILYIAYSCSPYGGSEESIGWNIPYNMAKRSDDNIFILTKIEQKKDIDSFIKGFHIENIHTVYLDIPKLYKKIFRGSFYSGRLNIWLRSAVKLSKRLNKLYKFDIIHQINPVEFRSIGKFYKIKGSKFIVGPIGGGEYIPYSAKKYVCGLRDSLIEVIRKITNDASKFKYFLNRLFCKIDYLYIANNETKDYLKRIIKCNYEIYTEIGVDSFHNYQSDNKNVFLVCGRLVYRKGHKLLIDAFSKISVDYKLLIVGDGKDACMLKRYVSELNLDNKIKFLGNIEHERIEEIYKKSNVLILPSLRETTGTVILEALSHGIPIITGNKFGGSLINNDEIGWTFDFSSENVVDDLRKIIQGCIDNPQMVNEKSQNIEKFIGQYFWKEKVLMYNQKYEELLGKIEGNESNEN